MRAFFKRIINRNSDAQEKRSETDEPIVPVFIPALVAILVHHEKAKGSPLTKDEVLSIRDNAACMTMRLSMACQMAEKRGYADLTPENCWEEWQEFRKQLET